MRIAQTVPHEYNHTLRYRTVVYSDNLFERRISEGLACHFAIRVCGMATAFFCRALSKEQFDIRKARAAKIWFDRGFDFLEWFVGLKKTIPPDAGYTVGFAPVGDCLGKYSGSTAASLNSIPECELLPK
jgi:uncharacterized protein YjaZ